MKDLFRLSRYKKRSGVAESATPPRPVLSHRLGQENGLGSENDSGHSSVVASGQKHEQSTSSTNHSSLPMKLPLRKSTSSSLPDHHDRESNVVLFGLAECASLVGTRERVDEVLEYLTGSI